MRATPDLGFLPVIGAANHKHMDELRGSRIKLPKAYELYGCTFEYTKAIEYLHEMWRLLDECSKTVS